MWVSLIQYFLDCYYYCFGSIFYLDVRDFNSLGKAQTFFFYIGNYCSKFWSLSLFLIGLCIVLLMLIPFLTLPPSSQCSPKINKKIDREMKRLECRINYK
jgi:hypothetical protein